MVAALESNVLDVADLVPIPDADRLRTDSRFKLYYTHDIGQFFNVQIQSGLPPTNNKLLRQAISYALDRKRITDTVIKGFTGEPRTLPWAKSSPAFDPEKNKLYAYDIDKAKAVLAAVGRWQPRRSTSPGRWPATRPSIRPSRPSCSRTWPRSASRQRSSRPTHRRLRSRAQGMNPQFNGIRLSAGAFAQLYEAGSEFALSRTFGYASNSTNFYSDKWTALAKAPATEPDPAKREQMYNEINDYLLDQSFTLVITPTPTSCTCART